MRDRGALRPAAGSATTGSVARSLACHASGQPHRCTHRPPAGPPPSPPAATAPACGAPRRQTSASSRSGTGSSSTGASRARNASRSAAHSRTRAASSGCSRSQASTCARNRAFDLAVEPGRQQCRRRVVRGHVHMTRLRSALAGAGGDRCHRATGAGGAGARDTRHHGADRDAQHLGAFGIGELLDAHQQQRLALLGRQACAARGSDRCAGRRPRPGRRRRRLASALARSGSTTDSRASRRRWSRCALWAIDSTHTSMSRRWSNWCQCASARSSVVCTRSSARGVEHQRARIAPQPRDGAEQLLAECVAACT